MAATTPNIRQVLPTIMMGNTAKICWKTLTSLVATNLEVVSWPQLCASLKLLQHRHYCRASVLLPNMPGSLEVLQMVENEREKKISFLVENEPVSLKQVWISTQGETEVFLMTWIHEITGSAKAEPLPGMTRYWRGPIAQKSKLLQPRSLKRIRGCMLLYDADLMRRFNSRH